LIHGDSNPFLDILVKPSWAPRGASRFLALVREKYYDGVAIHRVIPNFFAQFGIAKDYKQRTEWSSKPLLDDGRDPNIQWGPGHVSFAGE
jgi:cyclophilin family peptidyl-prolyl cis-trans isomerase